MTDTAQRRAIRNYRLRLAERGVARFDVLAPSGDRALIRELARRLAEGGPQAERLRAEISACIQSDLRRKGGLVATLRRSPLVGAQVDLTRSPEKSRDIIL